jgi:hypothetical protein
MTWATGLLSLFAAASIGGAWMEQSFEETDAVVVKFSQTDEYATHVLESLMAYEDHLATHCKDVAFAPHAQARVLGVRPVTLNKEGKIEDGSWKTILDGTACGLKKKYNVYVEFKKSEVTFTYMLPGSSNADLELQQDTLASLPKVLPVHDGCLIEVLDTKLVGAAGKRGADGIEERWRESWEVRTCKRTFTVPITFVPNASGTGANIFLASSSIARQNFSSEIMQANAD